MSSQYLRFMSCHQILSMPKICDTVAQCTSVQSVLGPTLFTRHNAKLSLPDQHTNTKWSPEFVQEGNQARAYNHRLLHEAF